MRLDETNVYVEDTHLQAQEVAVMATLIEKYLPHIRDLARHYGVSRLEVFGSICTSAFDPEASDIDFLVEYPPDYDYGPWLARVQDLEADLSALLGRDVDLVTTTALRNARFRKEVEKTRTVLYVESEVATVG
jgi:predicted nucleotidyltransferase